jgi:AcrR family transcriptional regulator
MEEKEQRILSCAAELFKKYGLKSITMDDIAIEAGISKKTLYTFFSNKTDIVNHIVTTFLNNHVAEVDAIKMEAENAIEEYYSISKLALNTFREIRPTLMYDLAKFYPASMKKIEQFQTEFVAQKVQENLERGIKEGFYRNCMNVELISKIYAQSINSIISGNLFQDSAYSFEQIYREFFIYHVSGVCNEKGKEYINRIFSSESK